MEFFDDQAAKRRQIDDDSFRAAQACLESAVSGRRRYVFDPAWSEPRRAVMALLYDQGIEGMDFPRKTQTLQDHLDWIISWTTGKSAITGSPFPRTFSGRPRRP